RRPPRPLPTDHHGALRAGRAAPPRGGRGLRRGTGARGAGGTRRRPDDPRGAPTARRTTRTRGRFATFRHAHPGATRAGGGLGAGGGSAVGAPPGGAAVVVPAAGGVLAGTPVRPPSLFRRGPRRHRVDPRALAGPRGVGPLRWRGRLRGSGARRGARGPGD